MSVPAPTPPRVSVILPTYNRRDLLVEAIDSVLAQTVTDFEFLVIDDGSTDGTSDHVRARYGDDARVRLLEQQNAGTAAARNRGLEAMRAPWTAFLDSDDLWNPDYLAAQLAAVTEAGADAVLCDADYVGMDRGRHQFGDPVWSAPTSLEAMLGGAWGLPTTLLLRSEIAHTLRFDADYTYSEDTEFLLRFHSAGHRLVLNPERLATWRAHGEGRKNDEMEFGHQLAQIRMLQPHWSRARARAQAHRLLYAIHRASARDLLRAGFWYEARSHLAACVRYRPGRPRVLWRWLRSLAARPSKSPLPPIALRRSADIRAITALLRGQGGSPRNVR